MPTSKPENSIQDACRKIAHIDANSHKGQNGRVLIIGGSRIFHSASLWAAETASKFVDLVHYSSTVENQHVFINLKSKFTNGIVIPREVLLDYIQEDDCILIGPGMERGNISQGVQDRLLSFDEILNLESEADYTYALIYYIIEHFPDKKYVFDAAALQVMKPEWLRKLTSIPIVTPHSKEFELLFGVKIAEPSYLHSQLTLIAREYHTVILLKKIIDYIATNENVVEISGGNEGLTKGGTGDALAGLVTALYTRTDPQTACILASTIIKLTAEKLYEKNGSFYNTSDLIASIPHISRSLLI